MKKIKAFFVALAMLLTVSAFAQDLNVKGIISDSSTGEAVPFASIQLKGTMVGTSSDANGNYSISVPADGILVCSSIGYATAEVAVGGKAVINFELNPDSEFLDETIVVAYGTASKAAFTGSAVQVKGDAIARSSSESLDKGLAGKVAGVRITSDNGDPGAAANIQIRGVGSINASTQPLYVIDGVVMNPSLTDDMSAGYKSTAFLNSINPEDIQSMTVLKDAAAASLYGSRAANGVIIITTKKGFSGKTRVSYSGEVGVSQIANMKAFNLMDGNTFQQWVADSYDNYYLLNTGKTYAEYSGFTGGNSLDLMRAEKWFYDNTGKTNTNWAKEVFRTAFQQKHQVDVSGGSDKTQFYASAGYTKNNGVVIGSSFERFSGRVNLDHQVNNWLNVSLRQMIAYTNTKGYSDQSDQEQGWGNASPTSSIFQQDPSAPVYDDKGNLTNASWGGVDNPHLAFEDDSYEYFNTSAFRNLTNVDFKIKFTDWLNLTNTFGFDFTDSRQYLWWGPTSTDGGSYNGLKEEFDYHTRTITNSTVLHFDKSWGSHAVTALAGFELEDHYTDYINASTSDFPTDKLSALSVGQTHGAYGRKNTSGMISYFFSANYNFADKYYVSGSFRRDGSSKLGADNRWGNFWSASGAWRLSKEGFMAGSKLFNDFKIKASYGTNGTLPKEYYSYMGLTTVGVGYAGGSGMYWSSPANNDLGWEKSQSFNVGFEWNMYGRVQLNAEYFNKYTSSLLFDYPSSIVSGFKSYTANIGNLRNSGVELEISSVNIERKNFKWTTDFNFTWLKNTIVSLPNGNDVADGDGNLYLLREGESMYTFNLPVYMGVNSETGLGEFLIDPNGSTTDASNRTNYYSKAGATILGKGLPDITGGMTNTFEFWRFDLSCLISYQFGGKLFDYMEYFTVSDGVRMGSFNQLAKAADYWTPENKDATYPKVIYGNPYRSDRWSSRHIKSTDNIRMREITLGYTQPFKKGIESLRLYFKATNPFMIWSATPDVDPDVPKNGYRTVDVPATRAFVFGVNVRF